jgi:sialidase-1
MTEEAEAIPRNFDMSVAYRNEENEQRLFEDVAVTADVAESRDAFLVDVEGDEVVAGSEALINVTVTNNLDEPVSDVEAKLFTDSPLGGGDNDGYIESLAPGETATVSFRVSADAGATPRIYPLQMDFRYDDAEGTSKLSDTYRTAVDVTAAESGGPPWLLVGGLVVLVAAGGAALYRRRRG